MQEKETKRNQEAKNRWINQIELQQQLKASEDQLAAERTRADQARKELTKAQLVEKEAKRRNTLADDSQTEAARVSSPEEDSSPLSKQIEELVALMKHDTVDEAEDNSNDGSNDDGSNDDGSNDASESEFDEDDEGEFDLDQEGQGAENEETEVYPSQDLDESEEEVVEEEMPSQALEYDSDELDASTASEPEPSAAASNDPVSGNTSEGNSEQDEEEDDDDDVIDIMSHTGSKAISCNDSSASLVANNPFLSTPESLSKKPPTPSNDAFNPFAPTARRYPAGNSGLVMKEAGARPRGEQRTASTSNSEAALRLAHRKVS